MTTFLTQQRGAFSPAACTAVLSVDCMPRHLRPVMEDTMVSCLKSDPELFVPGADPLMSTWFTAWQPSSVQARSLQCRQVLTGSQEELELFDATINQLAEEHGFFAGLTLVD